MQQIKVNIFWFRRDLRLEDNLGLFQALNASLPVLCVYHFDHKLLTFLEKPHDARATFMHDRICKLHKVLGQHNSGVWSGYGNFNGFWQDVFENFEVDTVYANRDYEPQGIKRELELEQICRSQGSSLRLFRDHLLLDVDAVQKKDGSSYQVFTPYYKTYMKTLQPECDFNSYPSESLLHHCLKKDFPPIPTLRDWGFVSSRIAVKSFDIGKQLISGYESLKDIPAVSGTTLLGPHLRFGSISVRKIASEIFYSAPSLFRQLVWREFFVQILWRFPEVENHNFKTKYDHVQWRNNEEEFELWCSGNTGFPLVDAGIRELLSTGYMHNRVRMVVASFLCKNLLIDWRWGATFFARHLLDYEMAANIGNWQWAAGTGCDAAPYFRVFNPLSQQEKFDPDGSYVSRYLPGRVESSAPQAMLDLKESRERAIQTYKEGLRTKLI